MKPTITYYKNGQINSETWLNEAGEYHRLDGPAHKEWRINGQLRLEGWYINNMHHRVDGPAIRAWIENGQLQLECWYINNLLHRLDGPAVCYWCVGGQLENEEYWINGVKYKIAAEFQVAVDLYKANEIAELF